MPIRSQGQILGENGTYEEVAYFCSKCGEHYKNEDKAIECENLPVKNLFDKRNLFKSGFFLSNDTNIIEGGNGFLQFDYKKLEYNTKLISKLRKESFNKTLKATIKRYQKHLSERNIDLNLLSNNLNIDKTFINKITTDFVSKFNLFSRWSKSIVGIDEENIAYVFGYPLRNCIIPTPINHLRSLGEVYITFNPLHHNNYEEGSNFIIFNRVHFKYIKSNSNTKNKYHTQLYNPIFLFIPNKNISNYNKDIFIVPTQIFNYGGYQKDDYIDASSLTRNQNAVRRCSGETSYIYSPYYDYIISNTKKEREGSPLWELLNVPTKIPLEKIDEKNSEYKKISKLLEKIKIWPKEDS